MGDSKRSPAAGRDTSGADGWKRSKRRCVASVKRWGGTHAHPDPMLRPLASALCQRPRPRRVDPLHGRRGATRLGELRPIAGRRARGPSDPGQLARSLCEVDEVRRWPTKIRRFQKGSCHLTADTLDELHALAKRNAARLVSAWV